MPPTPKSRHWFTSGIYDTDGRLCVSSRTPYRFRPLSDNVAYEVQEGDSLFRLAGRFYNGMERAAGYWWAIADFQPDPILDPTIALQAGQILMIPSARTLVEEILAGKA